MNNLIENELVEGTVSTSRNFQEAFRMQEGENAYAILAGFIEVNQNQIDSFAKFCGSAAGYAAIYQRREKLYNAEKKENKTEKASQKIKKWTNRNIYQSEFETEKKNTELSVAGIVTSYVTEMLIKNGAQMLYNYSGKKANYLAVEQVYFFLRNYALSDAETSNQKRAKLELAKIRNGLPITDSERSKIYISTEEKEIYEIEELPSLTLPKDETLRERLAYHLFCIFCQKYGDEVGKLAYQLETQDFSSKHMQTLLMYYDYLGFTGLHAKELIRVNANNYDQISRDQVAYMQLGRLLVRDFSLNMPGTNIEDIKNRCMMMAENDPYQIRRSKNQKVATGLAMGLGGILAKRSDIAINGGALALSQFKLEDGDVLSILEKEFKKSNVGLEEFEMIRNQSNEIFDKSKRISESIIL